jgi:hypothetical protein
MTQFARLWTILGGLILGCFIQAPYAGAQSNHSLGSGQDIYRIEVKNINAYEVLEAGDTDGVGELYELQVRLEGGDANNRQYHAYSDRAGASRRLINRSTNDQGNNSYVNIRVGNLVAHGGHEKDRNLWIHSKRANPWNSTNPIRLSISATELDCAGERVCRRRSVGSVTVQFTIPDFRTPPSNRCGRGNTSQRTRVDDDLTIYGVDNLEVNNYTRGDKRVMNVLTQQKKGGPRLRPINADICIASTVRPEDRTPITPKMDFLKNEASGRCLGLPNYQLQGQDMRAVVKNCSFQNTIGNPERTKWVFTPIAPQTFTIRSSMMDRCLTLKAATDNREGGPVKLFVCSSHNDQRWQIFRGGFRNVSSGKCLNVHGREHKENGQVSVYSCAETPDQKWIKIDEPTANDIAPIHRRPR